MPTAAALAEAYGIGFETEPDLAAALTRDLADHLVVIAAELPGLTAAKQTLGRLGDKGAGPVVFVCEAPRAGEIRAVLEAGAAGIVLAEQVEAALRPCVEAALAGQICVPRPHWRRLGPPTLSTREKQILGLVVMGQTNGEIAKRLFLAESTVKSHLSSAFAKLGVRSRNEAVDLILDPERGFGLGILGLTVEPVK